jgi:N-methylhydantoinase B
MAAPLDLFTLEVVGNGLSSIAEEMSLVVMRSARSPLLREAGDLSSALTDSDGALIAQGRDIPMHMGVMSFTVKEFLRHVPAAKLAPGDVWFLNMPSIGGNHLPDVKAIRPIFVDGNILAYAVSLAHWADIGGAVPGSYVPWASDAWQEGLRITPIRLFARDQPEQEKLDLILANVRGAEEREGDILAQMAACRFADLRLQDMCRRLGTAVVRDAMSALHARAEHQMREALRSLPDGTYHGEDFLDDDGSGTERIAIRVTITVKNDGATFDFSDSDDACRGPVNTTPYIAAASVFYTMKALLGPEIQPCGGSYSALSVVTRPGSILEPSSDRPVVGGNHETSQRVADAIFLALEPVLGDRLSAGGPTTSGLLLFAGRRADGIWTTLYETHGGGEGARADRDGMPVVRVHMSNVMNTPAEIIENEYPLRVEAQQLRLHSGGDGMHRGGDGLKRVYRALVDDMSLTSMFERRIVPPYGLRGGAPGEPFRLTIKRVDGSSKVAAGKANFRLSIGDLVIMETSGGGGYGKKPGP